MKRYGLVGYPLGHSFSQKYFSKKFKKLNISHSHRYDVFEIESLRGFTQIWDRYPDLEGVNVTIPYKIEVMSFLDKIDVSAASVKAVNVVKRKGNKLIGFNSDVFGFKESLKTWLMGVELEALIFGSGGSSLAVQAGLKDLKIPFKIVSREITKGDFTYSQLGQDPSIINRHHLLVNATPKGMFPNIKEGPPISYQNVGHNHYCFDLIYNPEETFFIRQGRLHKARTKNGLEMLELQAEKSWEIWNKK
tara:strand:+ start:339 stop:1082 length:744 start_codon:yes stop_codon:yes gene_type:complete